MPVQRVMAGIAAALLFATGVAAALADNPPTSTADTTTETVPTTTATIPTTTTTTTTTTTLTTTAAPTTTTTTTAATTTTAPTTTKKTQTTTTTPIVTTSKPTSAPATPAHGLPPARACPVEGVVVLRPDRAASVVGAVADARSRSARINRLIYPAGGAIITASPVTLRERACNAGRWTRVEAQLRDLSLFAGTATAASVTLEFGNSASAFVSGLSVHGRSVSPANAAHVPLESWGYLVAGSQPPAQLPNGAEAVAALSVHLLQTHAGLPAGTTILVGVAALYRPSAAATTKARKRAHAASHRRKKRAGHEPLTVTPPLGQRHFIFPVAGTSNYIDTYGAFRSDVPGNWHHGDDIFAPLGTPVVAVASGTINRVGWERLGGWRLWVRDSAGDEFYYAHLSGYAPADLHNNRVKAGEVIGFLGNTGDAFTTSPHLHFEVHPRTLLHLGYDGAVDPTKYLNSWTHLDHVHAPIPTHPPLPGQPLLRQEARYDFRQLLAARHLIRHAPPSSQRPDIPIPAGANGLPIIAREPMRVAIRATPGRSGMSTLTFELLLALGSLALCGAAVAWAPVRARLKRRRAADTEPDDTGS